MEDEKIQCGNCQANIDLEWKDDDNVCQWCNETYCVDCRDHLFFADPEDLDTSCCFSCLKEGICSVAALPQKEQMRYETLTHERGKDFKQMRKCTNTSRASTQMRNTTDKD